MTFLCHRCVERIERNVSKGFPTDAIVISLPRLEDRNFQPKRRRNSILSTCNIISRWFKYQSHGFCRRPDFIFNRSRSQEKNYGNIIGIPFEHVISLSRSGFIWIHARPDGLFARMTPAYPYFCSFHLAKMQSSESRRALFDPGGRKRSRSTERGAFVERSVSPRISFPDSWRSKSWKLGHLWSSVNRSGYIVPKFRRTYENVTRYRRRARHKIPSTAVKLHYALLYTFSIDIFNTC